MKAFIFSLFLLLLIACKPVPKTCRQLEAIVTHEKFLKHFRLCECNDVSIALYNSGEGDDKSLLCEGFELPCGKMVYSYNADFDVNFEKASNGEVTNPRIVYFKVKNKYEFLETETNRHLIATVADDGTVSFSGIGVF